MSKIPNFAHKFISAVIILTIVVCLQPYHVSAQVDPETYPARLSLPAQEGEVGANGILPGPNLIQDPSFEGSYGSTTGPWFQSPSDTICLASSGICSVNGAGYHSGGAWAGFGPQENSFGDVYQDVRFPKCGAMLSFYLYIGEYFGPGSGWGLNNFFYAKIDGAVVFQVLGSQAASYQPYQVVNIDVSQYADGGVHRIEFYGELVQNFLYFNLDDVSLTQAVSSSSGCAGIRIEIGGPAVGFYGVAPASGDRGSFGSLDAGPVEIDNFANSVPFVASERIAYLNPQNNKWTSYSELIGLPYSLLGKRYYLPWYNNKNINTQLRFGSLDTDFDTTVTVTIGGVLRGTYNLPPNTSMRVRYPNLDSGPVVIESSSELIIASERVAYSPDGGINWTGYSEIMGLPASQLSTAYLFPWYNNVQLNSQLRFGNVGNVPTTVTVKIGGTIKGTFHLNPNQSTRVAYPVNNGPVLIQSSGAPIIASIRVGYTPDNGVTWPDVSEIMGFPVRSLSTTYYFPWYNSADLDTQLRFANVDSTRATTVTVKIGGVIRGTYPLGPNESTRVKYPGLTSGPIVIQSSGAKIIVSERVGYFNGTKWTSFSEWMGLPSSQLTNHYVFPWYNNATLNSQLRFGVP